MNINFTEALHRMSAFFVDGLTGDGAKITFDIINGMMYDTGFFRFDFLSIDIDGHIRYGIAN